MFHDRTTDCHPGNYFKSIKYGVMILILIHALSIFSFDKFTFDRRKSRGM